MAVLVGKPLIQYNKGKDRYQIHRLLRQFGADKLAVDPAAKKLIRERHCAYYCAALQQWDALLKGPAQLETLAILDLESANRRAAWNFAVETGQFTQIDRGAEGLGRFYLWRRRFHEGENANRLAEEALALYQEQGQPEQIALSHVPLATSEMHVGQLDAAEHHAQIGLQLCREAGIQHGARVALWLLGCAGLAGPDYSIDWPRRLCRSFAQ